MQTFAAIAGCALAATARARRSLTVVAVACRIQARDSSDTGRNHQFVGVSYGVAGGSGGILGGAGAGEVAMGAAAAASAAKPYKPAY